MSAEWFIARRHGQIWAALRENGRTVELRVESSEGPEVGRIIKGRVTNVVTGIQSAFLDLGTERDGFLHARDLVLPGETAVPPFDPTRSTMVSASDEASSKARVPPIQDRLKVGREIVVQVTRGALGSKGARVSSYLTLAGRLMVLFPQPRLRSVSRKIEESPERDRLKAIVEDLPGDEIGFVARTAARGATEEDLRADAKYLLARWRRVESTIEGAAAPSVLMQEPDMLQRLLRDAPPQGYERIVFESLEDRERAETWRQDEIGPHATRLELHTGSVPMFEAFGLEREIEKSLRPRVWLKSGGYIVIEQTEALVSIDVNTGKFVRRKCMEETVVRTNLEAASEIARQLRLRDLGGIIVIDFVDMAKADSRRQVLECLAEALKADPARTHVVVGMSELGLLQLTRKRTRPGPASMLTRRCPTCAGRGRVNRTAMVATAALTEVRRIELSSEDEGSTRVELHAGADVLDAVREAAPDSRAILVQSDTVAPGRYEIRSSDTSVREE